MTKKRVVRLAGILSLAGLSLSVALVTDTVQAQQGWYPVTVRRIGYGTVVNGNYLYFTVPFTNAEADAAFAATGNGVFHADSDGALSGDISCPNVHIWRDAAHNVGTTWITQESADVADDDAMVEVLDAPGFVKIVDSITWCGKAGSFLGCAWITSPTSGFMATRAASIGAARGPVWGHELGHGMNWGHVTGTRRMMNEFIGADNNFVTSAECTTLYNGSTGADFNGPGGATAGGSSPAGASRERHTSADSEESTGFEGIPITDLVERGFIDSVPVEVADFYGPEDSATLRSMLGETQDPVRNRNIAQLLGLISRGSDLDAEALIAFADAESEPVAKSAALISIGYVANRGDRKALNYLLDRAGEQSRAGRWAIQGLGLSGQAGAVARLEELAASADEVRNARGPNAASAATRSRIVSQALKDNREIQQVGLRGHYGRR